MLSRTRNQHGRVRLGLLVVLAIVVVIAIGGHFATTEWFTHRALQTVKPAGPPKQNLVAIADRRDEMLQKFDTSNLRIDREDILPGGPDKDGIRSLANPDHVPIGTDLGLEADDRVIVITFNGETIGYPVGILMVHEIVNDIIGDTPIAVTYCPLCDSVAAFERRVDNPDGTTVTLEFGVSGLLAHSNVLMYDRTHDALWSQLTLEAMSGPFSGAALRALPFRMMSLGEFTGAHPNASIMTIEVPLFGLYLNHPYYSNYLQSRETMFPVPKRGNALPEKTLGVGILIGQSQIFITARSLTELPRSFETAGGPVVLSATSSGISVHDAPEASRLVQTFYYAWSAFHPSTEIIDDSSSDQNAE